MHANRTNTRTNASFLERYTYIHHVTQQAHL